MLNGMIVGFLLACVTQNALGMSLAAAFGPLKHDQQMIAEGIGLAAYIAAGGLCGYAVRRVLRGGMASFWTSTLGRFLIGRMAGTAVYLALVASVWKPAVYVVAYLFIGVASIGGMKAAVAVIPAFQVLIWVIALS